MALDSKAIEAAVKAEVATLGRDAAVEDALESLAGLDDEALKAETPATQKAALMTEVVEFVRKRCAAAAAAQFSRRAIILPGAQFF